MQNLPVCTYVHVEVVGFAKCVRFRFNHVCACKHHEVVDDFGLLISYDWGCKIILRQIKHIYTRIYQCVDVKHVVLCVKLNKFRKWAEIWERQKYSLPLKRTQNFFKIMIAQNWNCFKFKKNGKASLLVMSVQKIHKIVKFLLRDHNSFGSVGTFWWKSGDTILRVSLYFYDYFTASICDNVSICWKAKP